MKKIIMALVMAVALVLVTATGVGATNTVTYGTKGTGATATVGCSGVELYTPAGLTGHAYVKLMIPDGIALNEIDTLSYTAKVTNPGAGEYGPEVVLNIDADNDEDLDGTGIDWMLSNHSPASIGYDNFLSGDSFQTFGSPDANFVYRNALGDYNYWSTDDARTGFAYFYSPFVTVLGLLPEYDIDETDKVYSIDFVVGTSGNFDDMGVEFSSVELNGTTYPVIADPTKACVLIGSSVPGKGLDNAPGLQKPFNSNSQAGSHAGKK